MTAFEDSYRALVQTGLIGRRPAGDSPAQWWLPLIDTAASDVRHDRLGLPRTRPRADTDLALTLIDRALADGFPIEIAVPYLVTLARPDDAARTALTRIGADRAAALARAAELRARPGHDEPGASYRQIAATADHRDYHRLLGIQRILTELAAVADRIEDPGLAAGLAAWQAVRDGLTPYVSDPPASGPACPAGPPTCPPPATSGS